jgi:hypothetical protein
MDDHELDSLTAGELFLILADASTGAFVEVDGRRIVAVYVAGTPGVDQTVRLTSQEASR